LTHKGKIIGVSLGPGDPGLITVKGLQALQHADKIYYPASSQPAAAAPSLATPSPATPPVGITSYSLSILQHYGLDPAKLHPVLLEMSADRAHNLRTYAETFGKMRADCDQGLTVAFVSEGDISFYSTFVHLLRHIHAERLPVEIIAGVPAFLAAAAAHAEPLAALREKIAIIPLLDDSRDLEKYLLQFHTVVLIKVRHAMVHVLPIVQAGMATLLYSERVGTPDQLLSRDAVAITQHQPPYFSLIILKSNLCGLV
jgi:precorrin-2/cobalt-factor-2 C20-methyltransferase